MNDRISRKLKELDRELRAVVVVSEAQKIIEAALEPQPEPGLAIAEGRPRTLTDEERPAVEAFLEAAVGNGPFGHGPLTLDDNAYIGVWLADGTDVEALALYEDELGNYTMLRAADRKIVQYLASELL